jgi:hypothetical protein
VLREPFGGVRFAEVFCSECSRLVNNSRWSNGSAVGSSAAVAVYTSEWLQWVEPPRSGVRTGRSGIGASRP